MRLIRCIPLLLLGFSASAAQHEDVIVEPSANEPENACVRVRDIKSFDSINDAHLFVSVRRDDSYLFTMHVGCIGLSSAVGIAIADTFSRVCSNTMGRVIYRDFSRRRQECRIRSIERVANKDIARSLVDSRKR